MVILILGLCRYGRSKKSRIALHRTGAGSSRFTGDMRGAIPERGRHVCLLDHPEPQTRVEVHQFCIRVHVEGLLTSALFYQETHHRAGISFEPVVLEDKEAVNLKTIRMSRTAGNTDDPHAGEDGEKPVMLTVSLLLAVPCPEIPFCTLHLCHGQLPHNDPPGHSTQSEKGDLQKGRAIQDMRKAGPEERQPAAFLTGESAECQERLVLAEGIGIAPGRKDGQLTASEDPGSPDGGTRTDA